MDQIWEQEQLLSPPAHITHSFKQQNPAVLRAQKKERKKKKANEVEVNQPERTWLHEKMI